MNGTAQLFSAAQASLWSRIRNLQIKHIEKPTTNRGWSKPLQTPVVLLDGQINAVWEHAREGHHLRVSLRAFGMLSAFVINNIQEEAHNLGRFPGVAEVNIEIGQDEPNSARFLDSSRQA